MLLEKNVENETTIAFYDSSNLIQTIYNEANMFLYIFFNKGIVYSYFPISKELYDKFEQSDSQGKFFIENIKKDNTISYKRELNLKDFELNSILDKIKELKKSEGAIEI